MDQREPKGTLSTDPTRDPELAGALRRALPDDHLSDADVDALARRIVDRARVHLWKLESGTDAVWWEWTARWARTAIPIAIAAGIVALVVVTRTAEPALASDASASLRMPADSVAFAAIAGPSRPAAVVDALVGPATHDWLLTAAVNP